MRLSTFAGLVALSFAALSPPVTPSPAAALPTPEPIVAERPPAPAIEAAPPAEGASTVREIEGPLPSGLVVTVRPAGATGWSVRLSHARHLVALRHGAITQAGDGAASLTLARGDDAAAPIVWETTGVAPFITTRGTMHVNEGGEAELRLAEAPRPMGEIATGRLHTCQSQEDGLGGATVLCRVGAWISAANVTAGSPGEHVGLARSGATAKLARFDFPREGASPARAMVLGYTDGLRGVVVRAEESRAPGEEGPTLVVSADERAQPMVLRFRRHWHKSWDPLDGLL